MNTTEILSIVFLSEYASYGFESSPSKILPRDIGLENDVLASLSLYTFMSSVFP